MRLKSQAWHLVIALILVAAHVFAAPSSAAAFTIDPHDYFDINCCATFCDSEVQEDEVFYLLFEGYATCIKDLPLGVDRVEVTVSIIAQHLETDARKILNTAHSVAISPFPDCADESYEFEQRMSLIFPAGTQHGEYEVIIQLAQAKLDGWDITDLISESCKSMLVGTITCVEASKPRSLPPPPKVPSYLTLDVLGNIYKCEIRDDGSLAESLTLTLIEGKISLRLEKDTICLDKNGKRLKNLTAVLDEAPPSHLRMPILSG